MMNKRMFLGTATAVALFAAGFAVPAFATDPDAALKDLMTQVLSKGPNGEDPALASSVTLTDDELAKIKAMNATAATVPRNIRLFIISVSSHLIMASKPCVLHELQTVNGTVLWIGP